MEISVLKNQCFGLIIRKQDHCLAKHKVFNSKNDAALISWEDLFEMRFFASYIFKESNVQDLQLKTLFEWFGSIAGS